MYAQTSPSTVNNAGYYAHKIPNKEQPSLMLARPGHTGYETLSRYIAFVFRSTYGADVKAPYPLLMGLVDAEGSPLAALGVHRAVEGTPLFLERYLARPAESCLHEHTGLHIPRRAIAEVGNLASSGAGDISFLLHSMTCLLALRGVSHILFTGTSSLKRYLHSLGIFPRVLVDADPVHQGYGETRWGAYYSTHPKIMAGDILNRFEVLPQVTVARAGQMLA